MEKKRFRSVSLLLIGVVLIGILASGCSLVKVDPEKDKKQVVAEVDGTPILKESFNNYMAYYQMYYDASSKTFPTGADLKTLRTDILNDLVRVNTLTAQAKKDGVTIDEATISANSDSMISSLKTSLGDAKYASELAAYNTDATSFEAFMKDFLIDYSYSSTQETNYENALKADPSKELNTVVGKIGDDDVKKDIYNYRLANEELTTYYQTQKALATDAATMKTTNQTIFNTIAEQKAMMKYAEENKITPNQADIDNYITTQDAFLNYMLSGDANLQSFLDAKYLTVAQFRDFEKQEATASATVMAIQASLKDSIKVTDKEIQTYYDDNKKSYDTSTVSAKHILTTDQALADQIYAEAKDVKTPEEFDAIMAKYKGTDGVQDASDLGAFTYGSMVSEFSNAAFNMDVNTVSEPVKSSYGYHVIFVYGKTQGTVASIEDKKDEITAALKSEKVTDEYTKLKDKLVAKTKITIYDIISPADAYVNQLKTDLNVKVYEKRI
ncbi:SurA N-terminal domain-containing protein [Acetobacterium tundrae]|uniref:Peptidylprolyl isomerase n=1 Tax=Acetobacterium tundrae TaxID=132932 RepID=A0ABR6WHJ3_9FIRM|nr:SurA N-terminal domain-containing protein [Acetobacterium tundrae]MBC3795923.1 peptidylprolyl isomerase [Acetobacterium tundrae]